MAAVSQGRFPRATEEVRFPKERAESIYASIYVLRSQALGHDSKNQIAETSDQNEYSPQCIPNGTDSEKSGCSGSTEKGAS